MSPSPTGSARFTSRSRGDMPRSPRSSSVLPSSDRRWRLEISWPVTRVSASTAVRTTSSTSSVRLTASATVRRIFRWGWAAGRPGARRRPLGPCWERPARRFNRGLHERPVCGREVPELGGEVEQYRDFGEVLAGFRSPARRRVAGGGEGRGFQPLTCGRPRKLAHGARNAEDRARETLPRVVARRGSRVGLVDHAREARGHGPIEIVEVERLGHVVERAERQGLAGEADCFVGGHHDDGHAVGQLANAAQDLDAVQAGHAHVEQDEVGAAAANGAERLEAARRRLDGVPLRREVLGQDLAYRRFVIDDQDPPKGHYSLSYPRRGPPPSPPRAGHEGVGEL